MVSLILNSLEETAIVGKLIGTHLTPGSIVLLSGALGTGKTRLAKSICAALGVNPDVVISPTYTLVNIYEGLWPVYHVDLFRLSSTEDLEDFDWDDLISENGITLVEWPELLRSLLTNEPQLWMALHSLPDETRIVEVQPLQGSFDSLLKALIRYEHAHTEHSFSLSGDKFDKK